MKDGSFIKRVAGESLAQAARRISATPRMMFVTIDSRNDETKRGKSNYMLEKQEAWIEEMEENSEGFETSFEEAEEEPLDAHWYGALGDESDEEQQEELRPGEIYLSIPRKNLRPLSSQVNSADRTVPSTRTARREVFDGVHIPRREKPRIVPSNEKKIERSEPGRRNNADTPVLAPRDMIPELWPVDARTPRRDLGTAMEVDEPELKVKKTEKHAPGQNGTGRAKDLQAVQESEEGVGKGVGRQSDAQNTVNLPSVINRILDLTVPMTVWEAVVASREIRTGIMDTIRLKNAKAVLIGRLPGNTTVANWTWPRSEGVLIKIDVETGGRSITAIVDTGSQLDVVRADIAALKIQRPVDMSRVTSMNDANGGKGQLQGYISDVDFTCGGVGTRTDLWVSQQAPFELLLGRPWQRGNLVTIDEREEGTYLVFKDRETRRPRYELLAIPHEANGDSFAYSQAAQSLAYTADTDVPESVHSEASVSENESKRIQEDESGKLMKNRRPTLGNKEANNGRGNNFGESLVYFGTWVLALALGIYLLGYDAAHLLVENESGLEYKDWERLALLFRDPPMETDFETHLFETNTEMTSRSAPASPAPPRYTPRPFLRNVGTSHERGTPLVSPLTSLPAGILDRTRKGSFGPIDPHPKEASVLSRVQAASDAYWLQHRQGNELTVRPGSVVSPQTLFTGRERRANGQETFHAILLNARLLIHNPRTGEPGAINGHASVQLYAAPSNNRLWNLETPYATDQQIQETLTNYGSGVHREVSRQRRRGKYRLTVARQIQQDESSSDESSVSEGWRARPVHAPKPMRPIDVQRIAASSHLLGAEDPVRGYITHPDGNPPPFDTSHMQNIGRTPTGDHVLQFPDPTRSQADTEGLERPGTPRLPWTLMHDPPALSPANNPSLGEILEEDDNAFEGMSSDFWMPVADAWTPQNPMPVERWVPSNGNVERVHYNARACNWMREDSTTGIPRLVFANFLASAEDAPGPSGTTAGRNEEEEPSAASGVEGEVATSSEAEMEEGEVRDESAAPREENTRVQTTDAQALTRTTDPRLQSRADVVPIPVIGSGRKGAVITRSCYSSSASPASIEFHLQPAIHHSKPAVHFRTNPRRRTDYRSGCAQCLFRCEFSVSFTESFAYRIFSTSRPSF
jgi:hypothetical protein